MTKIQKIVRGDFGYIDRRKKRQLIKMVIWVLIIGAVIAFGIWRTGTRLNEATVLGIILVLPAAKSLISLILLLPFHSGSRENYDSTAQLVKDRCLLCADLVLTRYEGSMAVDIAMIHGGNIFALVQKQKTAPEKIREYLTQSVKAGGSTATAMVCTDFKKFMEYVQRVSASDIQISKTDQAILKDLMSRAV